ncbi:hypothetical protein L7F22_062043 [Adiantum nelumboides]|nr:hypothetical protein [Adiantum nelumboides]
MISLVYEIPNFNLYFSQVFKTASKGWAIRSWDTVPSGALACEYTGILMRTIDDDDIGTNEYLFELDCLQTMRGIEKGAFNGKQFKCRDTLKAAKFKDILDQPEFCIDAGTFGNVARFINHSCEPNLFVQCVVNEHHDLSRPRVWLFAADTIHPLQIPVSPKFLAPARIHTPALPLDSPACPPPPPRSQFCSPPTRLLASWCLLSDRDTAAVPPLRHLMPEARSS